MADIKTKDNAKGTIRTIDKAAVATQRMKQAYIATKEKAERSVNANSSSAEEYASGPSCWRFPHAPGRGTAPPYRRENRPATSSDWPGCR